MHRGGQALPVPLEWTAGTMLLRGVPPEAWKAVTVRVGVENLRPYLAVIDKEEVVCAPWEKANAGGWRVQVIAGAAAVTHVLWIGPAKMGMAAFETMVTELEEALPASIALSLSRLGAFAGLGWTPPGLVTLAQELERVRRALEGAEDNPGLARLLHEIAREPHSILQTEERWVLAERARRLDPKRLVAAMTRPGNARSPGVLTKLADRRTETSFDTYENRLLLEFVRQVDQHLRRLERQAGHPGKFCIDHGATVVRLRAKLRSAWTAASFLNGVGRLQGAPDRLTQVLLRRPAYQSMLHAFQCFRRTPRIRLQHPALDAPLRDVPSLYEAWGGLMVVAAALDAAERSGWQVGVQNLVKPSAEPFVTVLPNAPLLAMRRGAATAILRYQHTIPDSGAGLRSISYRQEPDLTLDVRDEFSRRALHVFDPKYKLADNKNGFTKAAKADVDKMHAYRDAIRDAAGYRVVRSAAILFPGETEVFDDGIAAFGALPGLANEQLRDRVREILA